MENCLRKETAEPYFTGRIRNRIPGEITPFGICKLSVKAITSEWSQLQGQKDHVEKVLSTISIDYSSQEIMEIGEAVVELLTRYKDKINDSERYKIRRIEPCGSMREHTAVWKYGYFEFNIGERKSCPYIEFDYLAVLEKPRCYKINIDPRKCCAKVKTSNTCSCEVPNCSRGIKPDDPDGFDEAFKEELCKSVESLCDCYYVDRQLPYFYDFRRKSREQQQQPGCDKCSVYKPTGQLRIDTEREYPFCGYSLIFMWTSDAMTLVAPEDDITDEIKIISPIKRLPIHIDFLPAIEVVNTQKNQGQLEHECFLVPKRCSLHLREFTWRLSGCVREIDHIVNKMSEKHRKCYKILKYMCDRIIYSIPSYHVKTSVLHHSVTCSDSSEDCRNCVTAVLKELKTAYKRRVLESFCYGYNLLEGD